MSLPKPLKVILCFLISLHLSNIPSTAVASDLMISTTEAIGELDRAQAEKNVKEYLSRTEVQNALLELGVPAEEVTSRVASLSESELRELSTQVDEARAGGDILVTVLLVVLIIFLVKRI